MFGYGSVPGEIGILPEYREVTGTPRGLNGPSWALVERRKGQPKGGAPAHKGLVPLPLQPMGPSGIGAPPDGPPGPFRWSRYNTDYP